VRLLDLPAYLRDTALRLLPHRAGTGLVRIGSPGLDSPVLLTCNFTLTVRRLRDVLRGRDAWLLVANSRGINVWCAAGGGHLTHHEVIAVLRTSGIDELVSHRELVLPQLGATGIQRQAVEQATGWRGRWGPARLEDLPAYLDRQSKATTASRRMRFPLFERLEMSVAMGLWMALVGVPVAWAMAGWAAALAVAAVAFVPGALLCAALPVVPITGVWRFVELIGLSLLGGGLGYGLLWADGAAPTTTALIVVGAATLLFVSTLAFDLGGLTPDHPSSFNALAKGRACIDLLTDRCAGDAECVQVCPRAVLRMDGAAHKASIADPDACVICGACVAQCPEDALRFVLPDGAVVTPDTIRTTHVNLMGRRVT
jgi:NAD-dependent dihydropyrimidine dehydrogenase PreA subunit